MQFVQAFPIAIIDEDYEGKHAAGLGMRQLAAAIEKEGFRVVAGVSYEDARRLVHIFNGEFLLAHLPWMERKTDRQSGKSWRKFSLQNGARTTDCQFSFLATRPPRRWCRQASSSMRMRSCASLRIRRIHGAHDRQVGAALPRSPATADVQGAHGLYAPGELFLAYPRTWWRRRLSQKPGGPTVL